MRKCIMQYTVILMNYKSKIFFILIKNVSKILYNIDLYYSLFYLIAYISF